MYIRGSEISNIENMRINIWKYQGVKEFHMLARIVVIVKLWLSVNLNMKPHIITHPMVTNDKTSSILKKPLKHFVKMV